MRQISLFLLFWGFRRLFGKLLRYCALPLAHDRCCLYKCHARNPAARKKAIRDYAKYLRRAYNEKLASRCEKNSVAVTTNCAAPIGIMAADRNRISVLRLILSAGRYDVRGSFAILSLLLEIGAAIQLR